MCAVTKMGQHVQDLQELERQLPLEETQPFTVLEEETVYKRYITVTQVWVYMVFSPSPGVCMHVCTHVCVCVHVPSGWCRSV